VLADGFGVHLDSGDELDDVVSGEEGGVPITGVLGTVLGCVGRSNLTLLLLL